MNALMVAAAVLAATISWLACFVVRRWAPAWGLVDTPDDRKTHAASTPLGGGLAIGLSVVATLLLIGRWESWAPTLAGAAAMLTLGLIDDRWKVSWARRLAIELIAAGALAACSIWLPASGVAGLWRPVLAAVWIVAQLNAVNMLDNMDGLAAGVAAIASAFLAAIVLSASLTAAPGDLVAPVAANLLARDHVARWPDALLPLAMFGALVGFLWHNRPPARLFMGDAGSYFVGFLLGAFSVFAILAAAGRPWPARFAPVCAVGVPLYDMLSVVTVRLAAGRSPFAADRNHVSHRLVALGLSKRQAVLALYAATSITGVAALVVERANFVVGVTTILGLATMAALAGAGEFLAHRKRASR
jgi:UDP-GlcNAc:undecaprenyl-phosphate GlcNAc-1-phosphate transferase